VLPPLRGALGAYNHLLAYNINGTASDRLHLFPTDSPAGYPGPPGWDCSYDIAMAQWGARTLIDICTSIAGSQPPFEGPATAAPAECDIFRNGEAQRLRDTLVALSVDPVTGINVWGSRDGRPVPFNQPFRHFSHLLAFVPLQLVR